jgi:hypothetical protein
LEYTPSNEKYSILEGLATAGRHGAEGLTVLEESRRTVATLAPSGFKDVQIQRLSEISETRWNELNGDLTEFVCFRSQTRIAVAVQTVSQSQQILSRDRSVITGFGTWATE